MKNSFQKTAGAALAVTLLAGLIACGGTASSTGSTSAVSQMQGSTSVAGSTVQDGAYTVTTAGHNGDITVTTTFANGQITGVTVDENAETPDIASAALVDVPEAIVQANSVTVDTVAGATVTSNAIITAVQQAINEAGGNPDDFAVARAGDGETQQMVTDIVVVGAGAAGVTAAVSATENGAEVILIEKTGVIGGASNLSWAGKFYNSSAAVEDGLELDLNEEISNWIVNRHWRVDGAAVRQYLTSAGETYDWLAERGYETTYMNFYGEQLHLLPTDYSSREGLLRNMLAQSVEANGGQVLTGTTGTELITNAEGAVVGVIAQQNDGTTLEISAKSVIIATGGYAGNAEMVADAFGFEGVNGGLSQNIGEGLEMAWAVGAMVPVNFGGQMLHQTLARATDSLRAAYEPFEASYPLMVSYLPNFMNVGVSGSRFRDETDTLTAVAAANTSAFQGAYHLVIVSAEQLAALEAEGMQGVNAPQLPGMPPEFYADFTEEFTLDNPWVNATEIFEAMVADGNGFKGNTPEELAQAAGLDVNTFVAQFAAYEEYCATGTDSEFNKSADYLVPMGNGPYYAVIAEINNLGSVGGLVVNTSFQVLDENRVPITGLYAAGLESEGVLYNDTYTGNGDGIGYAFTSGRLAGEAAALELED